MAVGVISYSPTHECSTDAASSGGKTLTAVGRSSSAMKDSSVAVSNDERSDAPPIPISTPAPSRWK
jgi:hypothetical protein